MFKALQKGYELPDNISEEQYKYIRDHKDEDKALTGFVGFGCSFGGKWFGGYARDSKNINYCERSKRSILKDMSGLICATYTNLDYKNVEIPQSAIIYADPPYKNTSKYSNSKDFNHEEFWNYMREISKTNLVFVSEQNAPEDFVCIWQKQIRRQLDVNKDNLFNVYEKLFVHKTYKDKFIKETNNDN